MAITVKPAFLTQRIAFNNSYLPLGERSQADLKLFLILSYSSNRADYVAMFVSPPTLAELLGNAPGGGADLSVATLLALFSNNGQIVFTQEAAQLRADLNVIFDAPAGLITYAAYASLLARVAGLEAGTGITSYIDLDFAGAGVVETAPGSKIWKDVGGGPVGNYGNIGAAAQSIPQNKDGVFGITQHTQNTTGDYYMGLLGSYRIDIGSAAFSIAYAVDKATGNLYRNNGIDTSVTLSTGDLVGFQRLAGQLKLVHSEDAAQSWTIVYDWAITDNSELFIAADLLTDSGVFQNPKNTA